MKKKTLALLLCLSMAFSLFLAGCSQKTSNTTKDGDKEEVLSLSIAATPFSGNVLHYIADYCGFYKEEGLDVEIQYINGFSDLLEAVNSGAVDVATTYGTSSPLNEISNGRNVTIFAGYMLQGCMPILARKGTEFTGAESFVGKTITSRGGGGGASVPIFKALIDKGYDPVNDVKWMHGVDQTVAMEMCSKGEADFVVGTTGIQTTAKDFGLEPVAFLSDLMPEYSCCRIWSTTDWFNNNQEAALRALRAWIRAEEVLENDPKLAVKLTVENTDLTQEYVEGFELDPHWMVNLDPHWKGVSKSADILGEVGVIQPITHDKLAQYFNCSLYKQALDECQKKYGDKDPDFYEKYQNSYLEANAEYIDKYMK
ncbi:MAG: ABC transporter substrate-binding protein [Bacillota bacterium]|jgi:NitT/TauT family transport system substrate-binding protein